MLLSMKKTRAILLKAMFLAAWSVLLLTVCGNEFISDAETKYKGLTEIPESEGSPRINWGDNLVLYVNPYNYEMSGTISGKIDGNGYNVKFVADLKNPNTVEPYWEILPPKGYAAPYDGIIPPEFLGSAALLGGTPTSSADGEVITLIFHNGGLPEEYAYGLGGQEYSFTLDPRAFTGTDKDKLLAKTRTVNFKIEVPSLTNYIKHEIEKHDYNKDPIKGVITADWTVHQGNIENLKENDDIVAAITKANDKFRDIVKNSGVLPEDAGGELTEDNFPGSGDTGFLAQNAVWVSPPDLKKGYWLGTSTLRLGAINAVPGEEADSDPVQISLQLNLTSAVGDAIIAIKDAEAAGTFTVSKNSSALTGSEAFWNNVIAGLINPDVIVTEKSSKPSLPTTGFKRGNFNVVIALDATEADGSPPGEVSIMITQ
jgi:hypothetical protein